MGNVLAFELLYRALVFPLMLWSADRAAALALRLSGYSYVTVGNLAGFLLHPGTILVLLAMAVFAVFLTSLEAACLLEVFQASAYYRREGALKVLLGGFLRLAAELRRKNIGLLLAVSVHGLFINAFMIVQLVRQIKPLNFVLDGMAHEPRAQLALAAVIFALVLAAVPSTFIVFTCLVEQKNFSAGMERRFELYRKRPLRTLAMLVSVNLLAALLTAAFYFLSVVIAAVFAVVFVDRGLELVLLLKLKRNLVLASIWVGSALAMMGNYGALTVIYHRRTARERQNAWEFDFPTGRLLNRKYLLGGLAVVTGLCMTLAWDAFRNGLSMDDGGWSEIAVTAHRGSSKDAPENTMAALETAVEQMADSVEVDVQETRDGVLVLAHDSSLRRTTGRNGRLADLDYAELAQLDAGSWFSKEYAGEPVPTLQEAVEFCKGRIFMNIELKSLGDGSDLPERVAALVEENDMLEQCVITSTSLKYLRRVKEANPEIRTGYIVSAAYGDYYKEEYVDFISMLSTSLSARLVDAVHGEGKAVHAWTVNSKPELRRMRQLGVDNVITDYPVYAREVLYEMDEGTEFLEKLLMMLR